MRLAMFLHRLARQSRGTMAIETAIVAPVLIVMSVGGFEVSSMVARQSELQSAAAEAAAIVRAVPPEDSGQRTTIRDVLKVSTGLDNQHVTVTEIYRCGTATAYVTTDNCTSGQAKSTYIRVILQDTYTPSWTQFGVGGPISYNVERTVQIS
jgi:Flp pilus assembly protein TadG